MASSIDATKPIDGAPASKADLRANLATAKAEIEALQVSVTNAGSGMRNRILNPLMRIDRRNGGGTATSVSGSTVYGPDRWRITSSATTPAVFTMQQQSGTNLPPFAYYLRITTSTAKASPAAGDVVSLIQTVEGVNWYDLGWGTSYALPATLSFYVRGSIPGVYSGSLHGSAGSANFLFTYQIAAANTWEKKVVSIPANTGGTWLVSGVGLTLRFDLSSGSSFVGSNTTTWNASTVYKETSAVRLGDTLNATLDITAVQLEVGTTATAFDRRLDQFESFMTGRYYETGFLNYASYGTAGSAISFTVPFVIPKRATPTVVITTNPTNVSSPNATPQANQFYTTGTVTATGAWSWGSAWSADAEL